MKVSEPLTRGLSWTLSSGADIVSSEILDLLRALKKRREGK